MPSDQKAKLKLFRVDVLQTLEFTQEMKVEAVDEKEARKIALDTCNDIPWKDFWDEVRHVNNEISYSEELRDVDNNQ